MAGSAARVLRNSQVYTEYAEQQPPGDIDVWLFDDTFEDACEDILALGYHVATATYNAVSFDPRNPDELPVQLIKPVHQVTGERRYGTIYDITATFPINIQRVACFYEDGRLVFAGEAASHFQFDRAVPTRFDNPAATLSCLFKAARKGFVVDERAAYRLFEAYLQNPVTQEEWNRHTHARS